VLGDLGQPAGTPREILQRLNTEIVKILQSPEVKERFLKQGVDVQTGTPEQFDQIRIRKFIGVAVEVIGFSTFPLCPRWAPPSGTVIKDRPSSHVRRSWSRAHP